MSDTATIQAYLDQVAAGKFVTIPPGDYTIDAPLLVNYAANTIGGGWSAYGANLHSAITNGGNLLSVNVEAGGKVVRGQRFFGLNLFGSKTDGFGLSMTCPSGSYLYNFVVRDMMIEDFGSDGVNALGNIFEASFEEVSPRNNLGSGVTLGNGPNGSGIMSSMSWRGGSCGQNGKCGMALVNEFYDLSCSDTYFLENGSYGLATSNGITLLRGKGFENNQQALAAGSVGPAIHLLNFGTIGPVTCGGNNGKQTTLLDQAFLSPNGRLTLIGCGGAKGTVNGGGTVFSIGSDPAPTVHGPKLQVL